MVEENFGFRRFEMIQNEGFQNISREYIHHYWRKFWIWTIWNYPEWRFSKISREILHDGWKFSIQTIWNYLEWRVSKIFTEILHHDWRNFLDLDDLKLSRMKVSTRFSESIVTIVEKKIGFRWSEMIQDEVFQNIF